jgi:Kef-type K+ transport system membrane component KefB
MRWRPALALGIPMNTCGLMELIALHVGLELGVIWPTLFSMLVIMAIVTTFATTPVLAAVRAFIAALGSYSATVVTSTCSGSCQPSAR